jgi:hypothetical protein
MKRLISLLISSVFTISLTGCGSQSSLLTQQDMSQNIVSAQSGPSVMSDEGLYEFVKTVQRKVFQAYDQDHNGFITRDEFKTLDEFFVNIDLDKNGKVSLKEATVSKFFIFDRDGQFEREFERLIFDKWVDKDADGNASRDEFLGVFLGAKPTDANSRYYKTLFTKNDINKDGILDFSEYEDAMYQLWKRDIVVELIENGLIIHFNGYNKP